MFPFNKPLKTWNEEDLQRLCTEKQPETTRLKYIKEIDPDPLGGRYELLSNITAMANSLGGIMIIGIEEYWDDLLGKCAGRLAPLKHEEIREEMVRIIESQISPGVHHFIHTIKAAKNGLYLVLHIPQSLERPHCFSWERHLCWYLRKEQENRLLTESEVRELYFQAAVPRRSLIERYNSLYLRNNLQAELKIVAMPVVGGLELVNTLTRTGEELMMGSKLFTHLSGVSSLLIPQIDHFQAVFKNHNILFIIKLLKNGEFMFSMGYEFLERIDYVPMPRLYVLWRHALKYFGQLYAYLGYYGPLRIFLETKNLNHDKIKIALKFGYFQNFLKDRILVYKDTTVDGLDDTDQLFVICSSFMKYVAQGCDMGVEEEYLDALEKQVKERILSDEEQRDEEERLFSETAASSEVGPEVAPEDSSEDLEQVVTEEEKKEKTLSVTPMNKGEGERAEEGETAEAVDESKERQVGKGQKEKEKQEKTQETALDEEGKKKTTRGRKATGAIASAGAGNGAPKKKATTSSSTGAKKTTKKSSTKSKQGTKKKSTGAGTTTSSAKSSKTSKSSKSTKSTGTAKTKDAK